MQNAAYLFSEAGNRLPRDLATAHAHAVITFPTQRRRDSGNWKAHLEKWLGDVLQATDRIQDDTHDIYSFGSVEIIVDPRARANHFLIIEYTTRSSQCQPS